MIPMGKVCAPRGTVLAEQFFVLAEIFVWLGRGHWAENALVERLPRLINGWLGACVE